MKTRVSHSRAIGNLTLSIWMPAFAGMASMLLFEFVSQLAFCGEPILPVKTLSGHPGGVYSLSFSSDSRVLISAGQNGTINLWNMRDFHPMRTWKDHSGSVNSIFYSPGGK